MNIIVADGTSLLSWNVLGNSGNVWTCYMRAPAPNQEKYVVLECGCITGREFRVRVLGSFKDYIPCENHPSEEGTYGQQVLRDATIPELFRFFYGGEKAASRRTKRAHQWVSELPRDIPEASERSRPVESTLF